MSLIDIARAALFTPSGTDHANRVNWGLPICWWGGPGIGKTFELKGLCNSFQFALEILSPGERGEGAFGVTPVPGPGNKVINYPPPAWVVEMASGGVVFLDEGNQASPALQPALMGILLGKRVGGYEMGPRVRTMMAANPTELAAGGYDFAPPVANRMGHLNWAEPNGERWASWLLGEGSPDAASTTAEDEEARVMAAWADPWAQHRGVFAGFIKARPELLYKMPQAGSPDLGRAWASPRTWEMACRARASATIQHLNAEDTETFVSAFVGFGAAGELFAYADKLDLPNPSDVLDGKVAFKHDPKRLDRTAAILGSCHALVIPVTAEKRKERVAKLWGILGDKALLDNAMDVAFGSVRAMVHAKLHASKDAYPVLTKMLPLLKEAGISFDPNAKSEE